MGNFRIYGGINTSNATQIIQSSATTWGVLKQELQDKGIMNSNMSAAIKENQVGLSVDGYTLPTGIGTGNNSGASIQLQTSVAGSSGTSDQSLLTRVYLAGTANTRLLIPCK